MREVDAKRMKAARKRVDATERMQHFRAREREKKIANGWVPGQKRVSALFFVFTLSPANVGIPEARRPR